MGRPYSSRDRRIYTEDEVKKLHDQKVEKRFFSRHKFGNQINRLRGKPRRLGRRGCQISPNASARASLIF